MCVTCPSNNRFLRWGLTEVDEEPPVALTLVVRHGHDAADIVLLLTVLLFGEVSNQVTSLLVVPDKNQVWSLTIFYSVDFSQSRIGVNKCVFYKRTIKVCVSCC